MPQFDVVEFEGRLLIGARRNAENDRYYWRITPDHAHAHHHPAARGHPLGARQVPIDDATRAWSINYHPKRADGCRAHRDEGWQGHTCNACPARCSGGISITLSDRSRRAETGVHFSGVKGTQCDASLQERRPDPGPHA
jgi:hypothetical protein